ncbi:Spo24p NDAI_0A01270 [Naumovozyma dairenensis CBS 421]|uniref:Uncharacterized protein n=1 Tax=Naumovozyma dairenensis (strain ATCC 10597 / BCRC 20456 / CBS 421 / NBRC 0211 / NRRL Y-12639) TaxID=1071378 RepID=G0W397_NAUDC|nr:hypothetical protein NDAI_0A01270 [Naumovozyma dairenensis CBS 421]CCD22285.1 hypothetical protein NDAI_0A01270 [Naumovozyma dairenensis CBS 421]
MLTYLPLLTSETSEPFIIPNISPVSQPNSRKNSTTEDESTINEKSIFLNGLESNLLKLPQLKDNDATTVAHDTIRKNSLTLL